jgi:hypothetical protein
MDHLKMDVPRTCSSCKLDDEWLIYLEGNLTYVVTTLLAGLFGFDSWREKEALFPSPKSLDLPSLLL